MQEQLLFMYENQFNHSNVIPWGELPLKDETFVSDWEEYLKDFRPAPLSVLQKKLVQLNFPVKEGMSSNKNYQLATKRGENFFYMPEATGIGLEEPGNIKVYLYQTMAGRIPVIEVRNRKDFETLVRVFSYRNEPVPIPASMGACMIKGYNNWDRLNNYKGKWHRDCGFQETNDFLWNLEFENIKSKTELYQDKFIILSEQNYSNVSADMLGISEEEWLKLSLLIRREHEVTHYCTLRFFGSACNHLLDELIADYMGLIAATGRYEANWFLCFMGLENYPGLRLGGRLINYLKNKKLSTDALDELKLYIKNAAENLEIFSEKHAQVVYRKEGRYKMLVAMSKMNLIELASENMEKQLLDLLQD